jgi:nicotinamidase-related amidase
MEIKNKHLVNWSKSALLIIDMQNFFYGEKPQIPVDKTEDIVTPIREVINLFRKNKAPIIWTKSHHETIEEGIYKQLNPYHFENGKPFFLKGSQYFEIIPQLKDLIEEHHIIIEKERYSAFYKTKLQEILHKNGITDLYFCGVTTNVCVESTIRAAFELNFSPHLIKDATASINNELKESSLSVIEYVFGKIVTSNCF